MSASNGLVTAEWRDLVMLSYEVDAALLIPRVPAGTSLDLHQGRALVTLVGLRFLDARVAGIPVPLLGDFDQINFRFYVRRNMGSAVRRGAVFIREIVPSLVLTAGARVLFDEPFVAASTRHDVSPGEHGWAAYEWRLADRWNRLAAQRAGRSAVPGPGSIEAFVSDRLWGYTKRSDGSTSELAVEHPPWAAAPARDATLDCDVAAVYGPAFVGALSADPISAFVADGSAVSLHPPRRLA